MYNLTSDPNALIKFESDMFDMAVILAKALKPYSMADLPDILLEVWENERKAIAGVVDDIEIARVLFLSAHKRALLLVYFTRQIEARMEM
jgi:hypothetical protein